MEWELFSKDYIKFFALDEIVNKGTVLLKVFLESDNQEKDYTQIRSSGKTVYRFNNFNVTEDSKVNCITFRPSVIGCYAYFSFSSTEQIRVELIKNGTNSVAQSCILPPGTSKVQFRPLDQNKYALIIESEETENDIIEEHHPDEENNHTDAAVAPFESDFGFISISGTNENDSDTTGYYDVGSFDSFRDVISNEQDNANSGKDINLGPTETSLNSKDNKERNRDIDRLERSNDILVNDINELELKISELNRKNDELIEKKKRLTHHLDELQNEYEKNYASFSTDLEEISARYEVDAEIIRLYEGKDVEPIERLLERAEETIKDIEEQIRVFVEAQESKTAEIEASLKSEGPSQ